MAELNDYTKNEYRALWATQSPALRQTLKDKVANALDTYLMTFGEAKNYNEHRHLTSTIVDATLMFLLADGWIVLEPKSQATKEEIDGFLNRTTGVDATTLLDLNSEDK